MSDHQLTFMGLTKTQFIGVLVTVLCLLVVMLSFLVYRYTSLADQGAQSHSALCVYKADKTRTYNQTEAYIKADTNGKILGFPRSLWVKSANELRADIQSLDKLHC